MTATTIARAWAVRRADGLQLGFTDHDGALSFEGIVFRPEAGLTAQALVQGLGLAVDNTDSRVLVGGGCRPAGHEQEQPEEEHQSEKGQFHRSFAASAGAGVLGLAQKRLSKHIPDGRRFVHDKRVPDHGWRGGRRPGRPGALLPAGAPSCLTERVRASIVTALPARVVRSGKSLQSQENGWERGAFRAGPGAGRGDHSDKRRSRAGPARGRGFDPREGLLWKKP